MAGGLLPTPSHQHQLLLHSSKCEPPLPTPRLQAHVHIDPHPQYVQAPVEPDEGVEDISFDENL